MSRKMLQKISFRVRERKLICNMFRVRASFVRSWRSSGMLTGGRKKKLSENRFPYWSADEWRLKWKRRDAGVLCHISGALPRYRAACAWYYIRNWCPAIFPVVIYIFRSATPFCARYIVTNAPRFLTRVLDLGGTAATFHSQRVADFVKSVLYYRTRNRGYCWWRLRIDQPERSSLLVRSLGLVQSPTVTPSRQHEV